VARPLSSLPLLLARATKKITFCGFPYTSCTKKIGLKVFTGFIDHAISIKLDIFPRKNIVRNQYLMFA